MFRLRLHGARSMSGLLLAAYFLAYATITPWFHTCCPFAVEGTSQAYNGNRTSEWADTSLNPPSTREDARWRRLFVGHAVEPYHVCLACLCTGQLKTLSPLAHVGVPGLTPVFGISPEPQHPRLLSHASLRLGPRAPPASTLS
jgi:hypothetical protein